MASVELSVAAKLLLSHERVDEHGRRVLPVLRLMWSNGCRDNKRSPTGEVIWEEIRAAGWHCRVDYWVDVPNRDIADFAKEIDGVYVRADRASEAASGTFVIDADHERVSVKLVQN